MIENFVIFIITHGRADNVFTDKTLAKHGYTGPVFYVVDNEDSQRERYKANYGERVIVFDKKAYADQVDEGDNFDNRRSTTHARNACFDIAEQLGYEWFLVLDDDYTVFEFRTTADGSYPKSGFSMKQGLTEALRALLEFYKGTQAKSIAIAQGGDFIGGSGCISAKGVMKRKAMNTFFCSTKRRFRFFGRNEDVSTVVALGFRGDLFLTVVLASVVQNNTQKSPGGMSEAYLESGTYVKSFYSVMYAPDSVKVSVVGFEGNRRVHHRVNWKTAVPKIVSQDQRKPR